MKQLIISIRPEISIFSYRFKSNILSHEAYQYALDSIPQLLALVVLIFLHPGRIISGKDSDFPSRKESKVKRIRKKAGSNQGGLFIWIWVQGEKPNRPN